MRLHHLAVKTADPGRLAGWYEALLGVPRLREHRDHRGLRSVWLDLEGVILMVERDEDPGRADPGPADPRQEGDPAPTDTRASGWHGVYFAVEPGSGAEWESRMRAVGAGPSHRTRGTLYGNDPDGNCFGLSAWPDAIFPEN